MIYALLKEGFDSESNNVGTNLVFALIRAITRIASTNLKGAKFKNRIAGSSATLNP